jgi:hypothetical protein
MFWLGKPEGKRYLARLRCRFEDNTKVHLQKAGRGKDWINLAKDRGSGGLL